VRRLTVLAEIFGGAMQSLRRILGSAAAQLEARHQPSGLNAKFNGNPSVFSDYVARTREMLGRAHTLTGNINREEIIEGNAPFDLKPSPGFLPGQQKTYRRGILLTHGLSDSPYSMRHLAAFFQENGFRVMAILLPGHGTQPGDLLDVDWQEWTKAVSYGVNQLAEEVDQVYLAGYSLGGTLSIYHSLGDNRVRGLFLFSPALQISHRAAWANLHKLFSWLMPAQKWIGIKPDRDIYKYESMPKNAAAQVHALTQALNMQLQQSQLTKLDIPIFTAASVDDVTVKTSATREFMAQAHHPASKLVLYTTEPEKFPAEFSVEKLELVNSVIPKQKILSSAHTATVISPEDKHYGATGEYANCVHYYPGDIEKYTACITNPAANFQGEVTGENLRAGILQRLMYNPNFAALKISMKQFIDKLP
jgi:esterase/lipase